MLTPLDIQNKEFSKGIRGYKEIEVDSFLDEVIVDYEQIYRENLELKDKISMLNEQIKHYISLEETLQKTLLIAQSTAEEVVVNARGKEKLIIEEAQENAKSIEKIANEKLQESRKKSEKMLEKAEDSARDIVDEAHREVVKIKGEHSSIRRDIEVFKTRFKALLKSQIEMVDNYIEKEDTCSNGSAIFNIDNLDVKQDESEQAKIMIKDVAKKELEDSVEECNKSKEEKQTKTIEYERGKYTNDEVYYQFHDNHSTENDNSSNVNGSLASSTQNIDSYSFEGNNELASSLDEPSSKYNLGSDDLLDNDNEFNTSKYELGSSDDLLNDTNNLDSTGKYNLGSSDDLLGSIDSLVDDEDLSGDLNTLNNNKYKLESRENLLVGRNE